LEFLRYENPARRTQFQKKMYLPSLLGTIPHPREAVVRKFQLKRKWQKFPRKKERTGHRDSQKFELEPT